MFVDRLGLNVCMCLYVRARNEPLRNTFIMISTELEVVWGLKPNIPYQSIERSPKDQAIEFQVQKSRSRWMNGLSANAM